MLALLAVSCSIFDFSPPKCHDQSERRTGFTTIDRLPRHDETCMMPICHFS